MSFYYDALEKAIHRHVQPDVYTVLKEADVMTLNTAQDSISVPLQADVKVAYDKGFARFVIHGRLFKYGRGEYLNVETAFDTKPIGSAEDAVEYIEFVFEQAKRRMLGQLADDNFSEMLKQKEATDGK